VCPPNSLVVNGRCQDCASIASHMVDGVCKRKPALALRQLSNVLQVEVNKTNGSNCGEANLRVALEGRFDWHWTLSCNASWLDCDRSGDLFGLNSVRGTAANGLNSSTFFSVVANSSGFEDNFGSNPAKMAEGVLVLRGQIPTQQLASLGDIEKGRLNLLLATELSIRMKVSSDFYLTADALELRTNGASQKVLGDGLPMDFSRGDPIWLRVHLVDVDGLRVYRSGEILEAVTSQNGEYALAPALLRPLQSQDDVHEALLPDDWFPSAGTYKICVRMAGNASSVQTFEFKLHFRSALLNYFVFAGVAGAILVAVLAVLAMLVWRTPERGKDILKSYVTFEIRLWAESSLEAFDILTDTLSCLSIVRDDEAEWLRFGYLAGYGIALVSSVLTFVLMWKLLVQKIQTRFQR
jgi:hypothetical protein